MKQIKIFAAILLTLGIMSGCEPKDTLNATHKLMLGEWHLVEWFGNEAEQTFKPVDENPLQNSVDMVDVWIRFNANGTFDLFQKGMPNIYYSHYAGTCKVEADLLSGTYEDGKEFGAMYSVSLSADNNTLTLTNVAYPDDVCVYQRESIPAEVIEGARTETRSTEGAVELRRFL